MRILMFAPGFAPYSFSENIVNSKLALAFKKKGWEIAVIARVDTGPLYSTDWHDPWLPLKDSTHVVEYSHGNNLTRLVDVMYQVTRMRYPVDGLRWAGRAFDLALSLHRKHNFDVVLSRSPNDIGHVPALSFSKETKLPWIANWNDPPAHLWPSPYDCSNNIIQKFTSQNLTKNIFKSASVVTFPSERLRNHLFASFNSHAKAKKTHIIPHIGLIGYEPSPRRPDGCFRICHSGNLSRERDPKTFLEGIALFVKKMHLEHAFEVRILGATDHELDSLAQIYGISGYLKTSGGMDYMNTLHILEQSDVCALVEASCREGIFLPSKLVDYVQVGRPLLAVSPQNGIMADLMKQTRAGEFAVCGRVEDVAAAVHQQLYISWSQGRLYQDYNIKRLWELFIPEAIINQYGKIFDSL